MVELIQEKQMGLTQADVNLIKDVLEPSFERIDRRLDGIDNQLDHMDIQLEKLSDDMAVVKDMVKDHSFRITRIERHIPAAE